MFSVNIDVTSDKKQNGIVRIFLGPKIGNKQQLNENRHNFFELDQFVVKMNKGNNQIVRKSCNFKNVVGNPMSIQTLWKLATNQQKQMNTKGGNKGSMNMYHMNIDTNNNNNGFPHRLILPKGNVAGEEFTLYVIVNGLDNINLKNNKFMYKDDLNFNNINNNNVNTNSNSNSNSNSGDSNSNSNSNSDSNESTNNHHLNKNNKNNNNVQNGNFQNTKNGMLIHNDNNCNINNGNGNGVLDIRAMGFPLDRQILDVNGFLTNNMFFKNVMIYHDNGNNNNKN